MENMLLKLEDTKQYLLNIIDEKPQIGLILGSGLGSLADEIENPTIIDYKDIPNFPISTVEGHAGQLVIGKLMGKQVVAMKGRFHYYEGYSMQQVTFPVRVMKAIGVELLLVTNACGGLNPNLYPGALMVINDHINMTGSNPLIGTNYPELGPRFLDMSSAYDKEFIQLVHEVGNKIEVPTHDGVYLSISGPNYAAKAELRMMQKIGADTIGMSTVPEVIVAKHSGMKVIGISCITDMALPDQLESISHEEVMEVANKTKPKFIRLVKEVIGEVSL
ncbi:purine-nucleoside phosphorylase [Alkaliphilus oremlandii]|uniref:Purine nucleoside phosphorylase n=1 Tax=Alkaliphilus oremlandii (strain OhILAs) TaxID=350688 RepID=A8MFH0_ALKOO|nr:purine-nucleoside phosphorylase [Alkaliphilus oremlandii]ABW19133.1 purine nucleoside phosphorylase I, inosine and guanosine-specific [Alkaliphilus oremlandii OhILAs]